MIYLVRLMPLELGVEETVRLGSARQHQHAAGLTVKTVHDPQPTILRLKKPAYVREAGLVAIRQGVQPGGLIDHQDSFIAMKNINYL